MPNKRLAVKNSLKAKKGGISKCHFNVSVKLNFYQIFLEKVLIGGAFSYEIFALPSFLRYTKLTNSVQQNMIYYTIYIVYSIRGLSYFLLKFPPVPVKK